MSALSRLVIAGLLTAAMPLQARDNFAAVTWRNMDVSMRAEDGVQRDVRFRRVGVEYQESVARGVQVGFSLGYSENEARAETGVRPVETISGNFGSLGLRFQLPLTGMLSLEGGADYLLQRDVRDTGGVDFDTRSWETRAELGLVSRYRSVIAGAGVNWRDIDFRETLNTDAGEFVRRSANVDRTGAFALLGLETDPGGSIAFRYDVGAEEGWSLLFARRF